jgi:Flp pilus assembly protein CpaB
LVGLAIALFLGAVAVVAVRTSGLLDRTPAILEKQEPVLVLVAKRNIFENITVSSDDVMTRPATKAELAFLDQNREKFMPANIEAAHYRIAARSIGVDEMLLRDHFLEQSVPKSITERVSAGMRTVNIVVQREQAASGLLREGEYVDVYLTTTICTDAKCTTARNATAPLAMHLKIIVKRDNLWKVMAPIPEDKPVTYILEANPYRAALIELGKTKGSLSIIPTANHVKNPAVIAAMDDTARVSSFLSGESSVTDQDLERIFNLKPVQTPEPPLAIEHYKGVEYVGTTIMDKTYGRPAMNGAKNTGIAFFAPAANSKLNPSADCPTCGKK